MASCRAWRWSDHLNRKTLEYHSKFKEWSVLRICFVLVGAAVMGSVLLIAGFYIFLRITLVRHQHSFEAQTSQSRLNGLTPTQVNKILGPPEIDSRANHYSLDSDFFYLYKSRDGEYAAIHFKNGSVSRVSYRWQ